jgi:hypothetical protein
MQHNWFIDAIVLCIIAYAYWSILRDTEDE